MVSTPKPPDPMATAQAQAGMNRDTAVTQYQLGATNQVTPTGSLTYSQNGWNTPTGYISMADYNRMQSQPGVAARAPVATASKPAASSPFTTTASGPSWARAGTPASQGKTAAAKSGSGGAASSSLDMSKWTPSYTATTALTPAQQAIFDKTQLAQGNLAGIAATQSKRLGSLLNTPFTLNNEATEARLYELGAKRLDPRFAADEEAMRTRLANSGIQPGSAAWKASLLQQTEAKNDAYNQLLLSGRGQAVQELLAQRNQPFNEISALLSGSQVAAPQFTSTPQPAVAGVDYTGLVNQKYQAEAQASQAKMGGLFGLLGAGISAIPFSDRRLKDDIRRVGKLDNGLTVYSYRMKDSPMMQIGLMADEVAEVHPGAVHRDSSGFDKVDYARAVEAA